MSECGCVVRQYIDLCHSLFHWGVIVWCIVILSAVFCTEISNRFLKYCDEVFDIILPFAVVHASLLSSYTELCYHVSWLLGHHSIAKYQMHGTVLYDSVAISGTHL